MAPYTGYGVYNLPNLTIDSFEFLGALKRVAAEFGLSSLESESGRISVGADEVPFICDLDFNSFVSAFPEAPHTGLEDAIRRSLQVFRDQVAKGWLIPANL